MAKRDYYEALGVPRTATEKEIRQAFRRLARMYHPDLNPGNAQAEGKFKEINEAYEVLSNPESRQKYDQYGEDWKHAGEFARAGAAGGRSGPYTWRWEQRTGPGGVRVEGSGFDGEESPFGDIFETFFGGRGRGGGFTSAPARGQDVEHPIEVTLEEAYHGATRLLRMADPASSRPRQLEVKIPSGVRTGSRVRIAGEAGAGRGRGANGDLYLIVTVLPHATFERKGDDLQTEVLVPLADLALGGETQVRTLGGKTVLLHIPPETQNGTTFRLAGQGMPRLGGTGRGDLYARVKAVLPTKLTERQRQLFQELKQSRS